jgi:oligopeptide/dipeptide ABC transporter ATP-binding protein
VHDDDLLVVEKLKRHFQIGGGFLRKPAAYLKAVDGIDFAVKKGETFALVGESGCGKTTLGRCILRLDEPTEGNVFFQGSNILSFNQQELRKARRDMQIVFQDPYASLDPRMSVGEIVGEPFVVHRMYSKKEREDRVKQLIQIVGLRPEHFSRYPHEFSGGQRQRIGVARALALHPKLIIADEPVSSLDVSIQAQILNLLVELQQDFHLTYVFISHDLRVVRYISDRVAVMYLGRILELAPSAELFRHPFHPYTEALISAVPLPNPMSGRARVILEGDVPSPINPPVGCNFHTRCRYCQAICREEAPSLMELRSDHFVGCYFPRS